MTAAAGASGHGPVPPNGNSPVMAGVNLHLKEKGDNIDRDFERY
jgi:hypothetical protein